MYCVAAKVSGFERKALFYGTYIIPVAPTFGQVCESFGISLKLKQRLYSFTAGFMRNNMLSSSLIFFLNTKVK